VSPKQDANSGLALYNDRLFRMDNEVTNPPRKNAEKTRGRPFQKGNPGRPKGAQNRTTRLTEALLEGEAEAIGRKCIERAKEGDPVALRLAMERIAPVGRGRPVHFKMPALAAAEDLPKALSAVLTATSKGEITPAEAVSVAQVVEIRRKSLETLEIEERLATLEARMTKRR
jgi:hypothetical protein